MRFPPFPPISLPLKKNLSFVFCCLLGIALQPAGAMDTQAPQAQIVRMSDQSTASVAQLLKELGSADVAVLGEIHDNPLHHQIRADLLRQLPPASKTVVAEHLNWRQRFEPQAELLTGLQAAGFDAKAWAWPFHQALFEAVTAMNMPLLGGNVPSTSIKEVFKTRGASLPEPVQALLGKAPFDASQHQAMEQEINQGHCGAMPASMFDGMAAVQRGRDAAMAEVALAHLPSIVVAGNGHAWKHLGVPFVVDQAAPQLRVLSVLFMEWDDTRSSTEKQAFLVALKPQADYVWLTPSHPRKDPCESLHKK